MSAISRKGRGSVEVDMLEGGQALRYGVLGSKSSSIYRLRDFLGMLLKLYEYEFGAI